jgi:peroxiredoxin
MSETISLGDKAPDFILPDTELNQRSLTEFKGKKIVLAFFIGAFTAVCTKEACSFRDSMARLTELNAQIIGISVNDAVENKAFAEKNRLPFPVLSDFDRKVTKMYGMEASDAEGNKNSMVTKRRSRAIVIIDKNGIIRYMWTAEDSTKEPDYSKIEQALQQIE